jgi:hypothetical protein
VRPFGVRNSTGRKSLLDPTEKYVTGPRTGDFSIFGEPVVEEQDFVVGQLSVGKHAATDTDK